MGEGDIAVTADETQGLVDVNMEDTDPLNSGFDWWKAPMTISEPHKTSGHVWTISGNDMQILTATVPPGEEVITEIGSFLYMHPGMSTEAELTLCSKGGCGEGCNRICGGESCVKVFLRNSTGEEGYVGITPNYPAKIIPIKFGETMSADSAVIAQGGSIMSQIGDVDVGCDLECSCSSCCAIGCCRQKVSGEQDAMAFLAAGGTIVHRTLKAGEVIIVDSPSVVAMEDTIKIGLVSNGRFCMCCLGGEGCCSTTLTGPGEIWMQSMPFHKFQTAVQQTVYEDMDRGDDGS